MKKSALALVIPLVIAATSTSPQPKAVASESSTITQNAELIFSIRRENQSDGEFQKGKWSGIQEHDCRVAIDCADDKFPAELAIPGAYDAFGVVRLKIFFGLSRSYERMVLRLARGGDETTVVKVDEQKTYNVTSSMLGSGEGFRVGVYELDVGGLEEGEHSLEFTVAEDGKGNGSYQWDALRLFGM